MSTVHLCAHGRPQPGYCPHCRRDQKLGGRWAETALHDDPGFQKACVDAAAELLYQSRKPLVDAALSVAQQNKAEFKRKIETGQGLWWKELAPLGAKERGIVLDELRRRWGLRDTPPAPPSKEVDVVEQEPSSE